MSGASAGEGGGRERELKLGVPDRPSLEALLAAAGGRRDPPALQVNHFFDTAERALRAQRIGFRLREEGESCFVTVKGPSGPGANAMMADRVELESALAPVRARAVLAGELPASELLDELEAEGPDGDVLLKTVRAACARAPLAEIGSFENERTRVRTTLAQLDVVLEFDRTRFPADEVRYEVELELAAGQSAEPLASALEALFAGIGVRPVPTTSKLKRFLEILDRAGTGGDAPSGG